VEPHPVQGKKTDLGKKAEAVVADGRVAQRTHGVGTA